MRVVLFLGYSGSGKTTSIEHLAKALAKGGMKVGTLKHIHHPDFTIDTPGKDTWRHARAGASVTVALAPKELAIICRRDTTKMRMDQILDLFIAQDVDVTLVEGFYRSLGRADGILRILCAADEKDALELADKHPGGMLCITGLIAARTRRKSIAGIPVLRLPRDVGTVVDAIVSRGGEWKTPKSIRAGRGVQA